MLGRLQLPPLYQHQEDCLEAVHCALQTGKTRVGVSLPTGTGKTRIMLEIIKGLGERQMEEHAADEREKQEILDQLPPAKRTRIMSLQRKELDTKKGRSTVKGQYIILVTSASLPEQIKTVAQSILGADWKIEIDQGSTRSSGQADLFLRILHQFNAEVKVAETVASLHDPHSSCRVPIIGSSGTFFRHDNKYLRSVFENVVYHRTYKEMSDLGIISPIQLESTFNLLNIEKDILPAQDIKTRFLEELVNTPANLHKVVKFYESLTPRPRSTLIFCATLNHMENLRETFEACGICAPFVRGDTAIPKRLAIVDAFQKGDIPILLNCGVLNEGADIPAIDCLIRLRPCQSLVRIVQEAGRSFRLSPQTGKKKCLIVDFCDVEGKLESALDAELREDFMLDGE